MAEIQDSKDKIKSSSPAITLFMFSCAVNHDIIEITTCSIAISKSKRMQIWWKICERNSFIRNYCSAAEIPWLDNHDLQMWESISRITKLPSHLRRICGRACFLSNDSTGRFRGSALAGSEQSGASAIYTPWWKPYVIPQLPNTPGLLFITALALHTEWEKPVALCSGDSVMSAASWLLNFNQEGKPQRSPK